MSKDFSTNPSFPLGLRNNNPGNLRYDASIKWKGQIGQNKGFAVFTNIAYGIRAFGMQLKHDITSKGLDTVTKLITNYAPPSENNTTAYINNVVHYSGLTANQKLTTSIDTLTRLARGMFSVELGTSYASQITDADIREGLLMMGAGALGSTIALMGGSIGLIVLVILVLYIFYNN